MQEQLKRVQKLYKILTEKAEVADLDVMRALGRVLAFFLNLDRVKDEKLCQDACNFVPTLARGWTYRGADFAMMVTPDLLACLEKGGGPVSSSAYQSLCAIASHCYDAEGRLLVLILGAMDGNIRRQLYQLVKIAIEKWPPSSVQPHLPAFRQVCFMHGRHHPQPLRFLPFSCSFFHPFPPNLPFISLKVSSSLVLSVRSHILYLLPIQRLALDIVSSSKAHRDWSTQSFLVLSRKYLEEAVQVFESLPRETKTRLVRDYPTLQANMPRHMRRSTNGSMNSPSPSTSRLPAASSSPFSSTPSASPATKRPQGRAGAAAGGGEPEGGGRGEGGVRAAKTSSSASQQELHQKLLKYKLDNNPRFKDAAMQAALVRDLRGLDSGGGFAKI